MRKVFAAAAFAAVALLAQPSPSAAATIALDPTSGGAFFCINSAGCTAGWEFRVSAPIVVHDLMVFDFVNPVGLNSSHQVGIWTTGGTLLTQTTVSNASTPLGSAHPNGDWLVSPVLPVVLGVGSYRIGAFYANEDADRFPAEAGFTTIPEILWVGERVAFGPAFQMPLASSGAGPGYFGASFTATAVPEPGTLLLIGTGIAAAYRRKRRSTN